MKLSYGRTQDDFKSAFRISSGLLVFGFLVLILRLWHLQILNGEKWLSFSEENRIKTEEIRN